MIQWWLWTQRRRSSIRFDVDEEVITTVVALDPAVISPLVRGFYTVVMSSLMFQIWSHTWETRWAWVTDDSTSRGEDHEDVTPLDAPTDPPTTIQGLMTRVRVRQLKLKVSLFLSDSFRDYENRLLPNDVIILRNIKEDHEVLGERHRGGGRPTRTSKSRERSSPSWVQI